MRYITLLALALVFCLGACGEPAAEEPTVEIINSHCPLMPEHEASAEVTVEYQGKQVGFCCPKCIPKWEALSDEEKAKKLNP